MVSFSLKDFVDTKEVQKTYLVYQPTEKSTVNYITRGPKGLFLNLSDNVMGRIYYATFQEDKWKRVTLKFPDAGIINNISTSP